LVNPAFSPFYYESNLTVKSRDSFLTPFDPSLFLPGPSLPCHFQKEPTKFQYLSMLIAYWL